MTLKGIRSMIVVMIISVIVFVVLCFLIGFWTTLGIWFIGFGLVMLIFIKADRTTMPDINDIAEQGAPFDEYGYDLLRKDKIP